MLRKLRSRLLRLDLEKVSALAARALGASRPLLFAAAFVLVVLLVHREVYSFILERPQYQVPPIEAAVSPGWAGGQGVEVVRVDCGGASLFDAALVDRVGRAFEANPWVRRVTAVERIFPDRLRVRYEIRRPHVAVRRTNGYVVVDVDGIRLPGVYAEPPPRDRAAILAGVPSLPAEPGRAWEDASLRAGMEMAEFVHSSAFLGRLGVREIDVANAGGRIDPRRSEITLVSSGGCAIQWGGLPSRPRFGEPSSREKLENLREILTLYPALEGLRCAKLYFSGSKAVEPRDPTVQRPRK